MAETTQSTVNVDQRPQAALTIIDEPTSTTNTQARNHAQPQRGASFIASSPSTQGRFGRMFREAPIFEQSSASLTKLAEKMIAPAEVDKPEGVFDEDENPDIPAGYTYFGQFVDHDITFDPASSLQRQNDPDALVDYRTPRFDLDSLYGRGPSDQPYLYRNGPDSIPHPKLGFDQRGVMFVLGDTVSTNADVAGPDLPRNRDGRAIIGDPRNDENVVISQLQATFLRFHNRMVETVAQETGMAGDDLFKESQRRVRWHYQWVVIHDFLARIVGSEVVSDILRSEQYCIVLSEPTGTSAQTTSITHPRFLFYNWTNEPFMPVEFSVAAYRFGHSMVRPSYRINDNVAGPTGNGRVPIFSDSADPLGHLNGFRPLPQEWGIQWKHFYDIDDSVRPQRSYKIDTQLVNPLHALPRDVADKPRSLAERNLMRGLHMQLPSGQAVAQCMGIEPLSASELDIPKSLGSLRDNTPLWYYILKEAEVKGGSTRLGPCGGRIVAEVLIGLLAGDPLSYLSVQPNWKPSAPLAANDQFTMGDLVRFATTQS